ncbi:MAG: ATP-binding protein [Actinomycetota bacterium]
MLLDVAVCLPQDAETVGLIRSVVKNALRSFGESEDCVEAICLALSEAGTNVIEHAALDDAYEVRVQIDEQHCAISVKNTGNGFDAAALRGVMPDPLSPRGRGVAIMRTVMDRVDFDSGEETGTIVHLVKTLTIEPGGLLDRLRRRLQARL